VNPEPRPETRLTPKHAPAPKADGSPKTGPESTVTQALNALAMCAETLANGHPDGPQKQMCLVQLTEAKRLIAQLDEPRPTPPPPPPKHASSPKPPAPAPPGKEPGKRRG
jgi:hypothetical protein